MALETLKGVTEINGHKVIRLDEAKTLPEFKSSTDGEFDWDKYDKYRELFHISITDSLNMISFKIQDGPIKENGHNGCQVDEVIATAKLIIEGLNAKFPCRENSMVITKLDEALMWLQKRSVESR